MSNDIATALPFLRLKSLRLQNFKIFSDYKLDFLNEDGSVKNFSCFIGPNGHGKSTLLYVIQLLFSNFNGRDEDKLKILLGKAVRHNEEEKYTNHSLTEKDFLITAEFITNPDYLITGVHNTYEIQINRNGFVKDHPEYIREKAYRICYLTRFDQELHNFQIEKCKWEKFKTLFEAVTGFTITPHEDIFSQSKDFISNSLLKEYYCNFYVKKPNETIIYKECSDGERKIIKSFSTLLELEMTPQIILVDNVEMHIESSRHLHLIKALKSCFPLSQIFVTTHSYHISRNINEMKNRYDLRMMYANDNIKENPRMLNLIDEISDSVIKLDSIPNLNSIVEEGKMLKDICLNKKVDVNFIEEKIISFLNKAQSAYVKALLESK